MPDWRVDIRNFGRIDTASITMAPLVVLVGRNNSGKSYIASLLWSLLNIDNTLFPRKSRPAAPAWFEHFLEQNDGDRPVDKQALAQWLNEVLAKRKNEIVRSLLSYDAASIGSISISFGEGRDCYISLDDFIDDDPDFTVAFNVSPRGKADVKINYMIGGGEDSLGYSPATLMIEDVVDAVMSGRQDLSPGGAPIYVPAARTGLMLALPLIFGELLGTLGLSGDGIGGQFPLPTINFLQRLVNAKAHGDPSLAGIAELLQTNLLRGSVQRERGTGVNFSYTPANGSAIPLHTASSMVSELAPLLVLLRSVNMERGLVFEEPESHLHLDAQREVARAIARLVNLGVPVVLTTHSDTFVQQLNILIALHDHPDRERLMTEFGYDVADIINPADVRGYEFVGNERGRTDVRPARMIETGLVIESLNDVLIELSQEALAVQDR